MYIKNKYYYCTSIKNLDMAKNKKQELAAEVSKLLAKDPKKATPQEIEAIEHFFSYFSLMSANRKDPRDE